MFHLSLRFGFPHPDYLLPYLSAGQLYDWQRYSNQFGLGIDREDIHWGMLLSMFFNANRTQGSEAKTAKDMMPYFKQPEEDVSAEDFQERIKTLIRTKT